MTTVTPLRNEMSTTLPLLNYRDVSKKLIFFNNNESHARVTHVAVLNYTLSKYMKGALCLLLRRGASLEAFHRVQCFPALLPHLGELASRLQKTKILICPGANNSTQLDRVDTTFSVKSDSFTVREWSAKGSIQHSISPVNGKTTELKVQMSEPGNSKRSAQVSCQIEDSQNPTLKISLQLIRINKTWSIREVAEVKEGIRSRKQHAPFRSSHLADRCSLSLSGGKRLSVGLRRLPAVCRARSGDSVSQYRYQIVVRYL
jgi:hypothetical protein